MQKKIESGGAVRSSTLIIAATILASILYGAKNIDVSTVFASILEFDTNSIDHQIIMSSRLPRVIGALLIGAFGRIRGSDAGDDKKLSCIPFHYGVSDGSVVVITLCMVFMPNTSSLGLIFIPWWDLLWEQGSYFSLPGCCPAECPRCDLLSWARLLVRFWVVCRRQ